MDEFYLQDSRSYVGNDVLWWAKAGNGYTTDLSRAQVFTREEAQQHHDARRSDIPWPKAYIDGKVRPAVDMQYIRRYNALALTHIEEAQNWLNRRTLERTRRGVEGTHKV